MIHPLVTNTHHHCGHQRRQQLVHTAISANFYCYTAATTNTTTTNTNDNTTVTINSYRCLLLLLTAAQT